MTLHPAIALHAISYVWQCHAFTESLLWNTIVSDLHKASPRIELERIRANVRFIIVSSPGVGVINAGAGIAVLLPCITLALRKTHVIRSAMNAAIKDLLVRRRSPATPDTVVLELEAGPCKTS